MNKSLIAGRRILIVEDDALIQKLLRRIFENAGAQVIAASDGASGLKQYHIERPDLVVLNVRLPRVDGMRLCRRIKEKSNVPVLFLSTANVSPDILGQESCDDADFLQKPFTRRQLLTWASRALYRQTEILEDGILHLNLDEGKVAVRGEAVHLSHTEYRLLEFLVQHAGIVLTYEQLLRQVWGWSNVDNPAVVHVYISRLRKKIEPDPKKPRYLLLAYGVGYQFSWPGST